MLHGTCVVLINSWIATLNICWRGRWADRVYLWGTRTRIGLADDIKVHGTIDRDKVHVLVDGLTKVGFGAKALPQGLQMTHLAQ